MNTEAQISKHMEGINEAERHRPAPRLWASFSRAAPRVQLLRQYQDKYAIFRLELENYGPSPTMFH